MVVGHANSPADSGLPDLSGDPEVRAEVIRRIREHSEVVQREGAKLGVPKHELERIRRGRVECLRVLQAAWLKRYGIGTER